MQSCETGKRGEGEYNHAFRQSSLPSFAIGMRGLFHKGER